MLPLESLQSGDWAEVEEVTGKPVWIGRVAELGVRVGIRLQIVRRGNPCLLRIDGSCLSLRGEPGAQILVRPLAPVR